MYATYRIKAEEFTGDFLKSVQETFKGKEIEISIAEIDETDYLLRSPKNKEILFERLQDIEQEKQLKVFSVEEFENIL